MIKSDTMKPKNTRVLFDASGGQTRAPAARGNGGACPLALYNAGETEATRNLAPIIYGARFALVAPKTAYLGVYIKPFTGPYQIHALFI